MRWRRALLWGGLALILVVVDGAAAQKEWLRRHGQPLLLELAPRDPRSLLQGDYVTLDYAVARDALRETNERSGTLVVTVDEHAVGRFTRVVRAPESLGPSQRTLRFRHRDGRLRIGPDAFFFQEGEGPHFAAARFAELRTNAAGNVLLVGLRDADGHPL